jgi:hypothetical protein
MNLVWEKLNAKMQAWTAEHLARTLETPRWLQEHDNRDLALVNRCRQLVHCIKRVTWGAPLY